MAKNETKRIKPSVLTEDANSLTALEQITTYQPNNQNYTLAKVQAGCTQMTAMQKEETRIQELLDGARDNAVAAEWEFHNLILGAKKQVVAQFGENSNEIQSMGLKKRSEYRSPVRRKTTANPS